MKKLVIIAILKLFLPASGHTQSNVAQKLVFPQKLSVNVFSKTCYASYKLSFKDIDAEPGYGNSLLSFLNGQPIAKGLTPLKRPALIFTEFSFPDLLENTIHGFNAGLINTYDDHISELFRDAPSLFKLKCIISL